MSEHNIEESETYSFNDCVLDAGQRELRVGDQPVTMQPKAFELLLHLVRNRHRAVDKDELQDRLWPRSIVTETALTRCVMKARRAVGDSAERQSVIRTVHGHGYRFIAEVRKNTAEDAPTPAEKPQSWRWRASVPALLGAAVVMLAVLWWLLAPPAFSNTARVAVLPIENATGESDLDWTRTGFMALINRMLEDRSIDVVDARSVSSLAETGGARGHSDPQDRQFRNTLQKTTGFTHLLATTLERDADVYRLSVTISGNDDRPESRTFVGTEPAQLVSQLATTVAAMLTSGTPAPLREGTVSDDDFINEAYARALNLEFEGRYEDAQRMFQVIIEQEPQLFWPRYEYALCARNLRQYDAAERLLVELRAEAEENGELKRQAAVNNSLGIMYMGRRRNDEARSAFESAMRLAEEAGNLRYLATASQNLGLLAKNMGDIEEAYQHMLKARDTYAGLDIQSLPGTLLNNLSGVLIQMGRLDEAEQQSQAAIENFRLTGQRLFESYALSRLSSIYRRNGQLQQAETTAQSALAVRRELEDERGIASSLLTLSDIALDRGDLTRAHQYAQQAADIGAAIDDQDVTVDALNTRAKAELALQRPHDALASYTASEAIARSVDNRQSEFAARYGIARAWINIGDFDTAASIAEELLADSRSNNRRREETAGLNLQAEIALARQQWDSAIARLREVVGIATEIGDSNLSAAARIRLAGALIETGRFTDAANEIDTVLTDRPADADVYRLQASLASYAGDAARAVELMTVARSSAGESWHERDDDLLETYRRQLTRQSD